MNKYEFRVLCYDDGDSCNFVKRVMSDFTIYPHPNIPGYDHLGIKYFLTDQDAQQRKKDLIDSCKEKVLKIDIYEAV